MTPREIFLTWCNLVRLGVYFDPILSLKFLKNIVFWIKNKYFSNTLAFLHAMGYYS